MSKKGFLGAMKLAGFLRLLKALCCDEHRRFVYEEEPGASSFFVPYIWSLVVQITAQNLCWDLRNAELLANAQQ